MSDCSRLSDRMPEVASGAASWTREEATHLLACVACATEWRLTRAAASLGAPAAGRVDADRLAGAVLARLRQPTQTELTPRAAWIRRAAVSLATAAALALAVWYGTARSPEAGSAAAVMAVLPELDDLDEAELEALVEEFGVAADPTIRPLEAPESFEDLSDAEIESLLRMMEG